VSCATFISLGFQDNLYFYVGQLLAMSVFHGGPNPDFLSKIAIKMILGAEVEPSEQDIPESSFREMVLKVRVWLYL
jgi:hypothetical protein